MDEIQREAIRAEGLDPDDPIVVTAIDFIRWELPMLHVQQSTPTTNPLDIAPVPSFQSPCRTPSQKQQRFDAESVFAVRHCPSVIYGHDACRASRYVRLRAQGVACSYC